eukprot:5737788-Pleurochrysis_carterae.AAC.3
MRLCARLCARACERGFRPLAEGKRNLRGVLSSQRPQSSSASPAVRALKGACARLQHAEAAESRVERAADLSAREVDGLERCREPLELRQRAADCRVLNATRRERRVPEQSRVLCGRNSDREASCFWSEKSACSMCCAE